MAEHQTQASCFQSRFGGGNITPANYIVEIICERLALKEGLSSLPFKFWSTTKWKKVYMQQLLIATGLLKMYSPTAIIAGLKRNPKCYSLRATWLDDCFKEEQEKYENKRKSIEQSVIVAQNEEEKEPEPVLDSKPRESFAPRKSIKSKLRD
jgi:hypothetical protein